MDKVQAPGGNFDLVWVDNQHGDGSGFTLQAVGDTLYIDIYAEKGDVETEKFSSSIITSVSELREALEEA